MPFSIPGFHQGFHITIAHCISFRLLLAVTVCQTFLVFHDLDIFEDYCSGILWNGLQFRDSPMLFHSDFTAEDTKMYFYVPT